MEWVIWDNNFSWLTFQAPQGALGLYVLVTKDELCMNDFINVPFNNCAVRIENSSLHNHVTIGDMENFSKRYPLFKFFYQDENCIFAQNIRITQFPTANVETVELKNVVLDPLPDNLNVKCRTLKLFYCVYAVEKLFLLASSECVENLESSFEFGITDLGVSFPRLVRCSNFRSGAQTVSETLALAKKFPRLCPNNVFGWRYDETFTYLFGPSPNFLFFHTRCYAFDMLKRMKITAFLVLKPLLGRDVAKLISRIIALQDIPLGEPLQNYLDAEAKKNPLGLTAAQFRRADLSIDTIFDFGLGTRFERAARQEMEKCELDMKLLVLSYPFSRPIYESARKRLQYATERYHQIVEARKVKKQKL